MIKRLLQYFIVKTGVGPLAWVYRACYMIALKRIAYVLKKQPDIIAVYLVAGMAGDDYTPGLSDIDLIIIVKDVQGGKQRALQCYTRLCREIIFLKNDEQGLYSIEEVEHSYRQGDPFLKYKFFIECKGRGKLLCGEDILGGFKELDAAQRNEFIIGQLSFIWSIFLRVIFVSDKTTDAMAQNYSCFKITGDMCRAFISVRDGRDIFNRRDALKAAASYFDASRKGHGAAMAELAQRRFRGRISRIVDDTYDFCLDSIQEAVGHMPAVCQYAEDQEAFDHKNYDFTGLDFILADDNRRAIDTFVELVKRKYSQYIMAVLVSPPDLLHIEEQNIGIFITSRKRVPLDIIKEMTAALGAQACPQRLCLYAASCDVAISLNGFSPSRIHSSIFSMQMMAPTLLYLSSPDAVRYGQPLRYQASKKIMTNYFWHDVREVIRRDKIVINRLINDKSLVRASNIEFQLFFWQALRLKLIEGPLDTGRIFIPLSSRQACRRCKDLKEFNFPWLDEFHDEYKKDLNGLPSDSEFYFPRALRALKELYAFKTDPTFAKD